MRTALGIFLVASLLSLLAAVGLRVGVLTGGKQGKVPSGALLGFQLCKPVTIRMP